MRTLKSIYFSFASLSFKAQSSLHQREFHMFCLWFPCMLATLININFGGVSLFLFFWKRESFSAPFFLHWLMYLQIRCESIIKLALTTYQEYIFISSLSLPKLNFLPNRITIVDITMKNMALLILTKPPQFWKKKKKCLGLCVLLYFNSNSFS